MMKTEVKTGTPHTANDLFWAGLLATESIAICADESQIDSKLQTAVKFYLGLCGNLLFVWMPLNL